MADFTWQVPYLPVDPKDLGRSYEAVIRVNSQSGKGGVAYLLKNEHSLDLPRRAQIEFSGVIQTPTDTVGGEVSGAQLWQVFQDEYLPSRRREDGKWGRYSLGYFSTETDDDGAMTLHATVAVDGVQVRRTGPATARSRRCWTSCARTALTSGCWTTASMRCPRVATPVPRRTLSALSVSGSCGASALTPAPPRHP